MVDVVNKPGSVKASFEDLIFWNRKLTLFREVSLLVTEDTCEKKLARDFCSCLITASTF